MPKASLLNEEDRDQLLKEMAYGIPIQELSKKYGLRPIQIEYQRGNNSALYNLYLDYFCIKEEIVMMDLPELYQFVLNILWDKITVQPNGRYLYKGNLYRANELIPFANEILKREDLPLIEVGKPVRVRYSTKRETSPSVCQDLSEPIECFDFVIETLANEQNSDNTSDSRKQFIEDCFYEKAKKVSWKSGIIFTDEQASDIPMIKLWYRILTDGQVRSRDRIMTEANIVFDILKRLNLLSSSWVEVYFSEKRYALYKFTDNVPFTKPFEFYGYEVCKKIDEFVNKYGTELPKRCLYILCNLGALLTKDFIQKNEKLIKSFIKSLLDKDDFYIKCLNRLISKKMPNDDLIPFLKNEEELNFDFDEDELEIEDDEDGSN